KEGWQEQTALMWAAAEDHPDAVKVLIENGADANLKSKLLEGAPPRLQTPPDQGQQGVHVTFPKGGLTAVHYAARQNALGAIAALADMHVDLDAKDPDGFTPAILAILSGNYEAAAVLVEKGAGVDTPDLVAAGLNWRRAVVGLGSGYNEANVAEAVRICLDRGLEVDAFNDLGQTALHGAVALGSGRGGANVEDQATVPAMKVIRLLVERGARFDIKDKAGRTPLDEAIANANTEAVAYFQGQAASTPRNGK